MLKSEVNIHEEMFARYFIKPAKRDRYLSLLESGKGRAKLAHGLNHCGDLDTRFAKLLPIIEQNPESIYKILKRKGANETCYVMSSDYSHDGQELPLLEALEAIIGFGSGTLVSCLPGKLAYFEFEDPGERYILER